MGVVLFDPPPHFSLGPGGFFSIQPREPSLGVAFFQVLPDPGLALHGTDIVSPSGLYTARAAAGTLEVFQATDISNYEESQPHASLAGCSLLLAWAEGAERFACCEGDEIRIFDLNQAKQPPALTSFTVGGDYIAALDGVVGERRAFSLGGEWFAFSTVDELYIADLHGGSGQVVRVDPNQEGDGSPAELVFSPDGRFLLVHRGSRLLLRSLELPDSNPLPLASESLNEPLAASLPCEEDFPAAPTAWCGAPRTDHVVVVWSPDSTVAAFRTENGQLWFIDFTAADGSATGDTPMPQLVSHGCSEACFGQYAFRP
jgi:hypothetical protein